MGHKVINVKLLLLLPLALSLQAKILHVKHHLNSVDTKTFKPINIGKSSFVKKVLYDKNASKMLIKLDNRWYEYCNVKDVKMWQDDNASTIYHKYFKGNKSLFCPSF